MKRKRQKILAAILAVSMLFGSVPATFALTDTSDKDSTAVETTLEEAETSGGTAESPEGGEKVKDPSETQPESVPESSAEETSGTEETIPDSANSKLNEGTGESVPSEPEQPEVVPETRTGATPEGAEADPGEADTEPNLAVRDYWTPVVSNTVLSISLFAIGAGSASGTGATATITHGAGRPYGSDESALNYDFTVTTGGSSQKAYCAIASVPAPDSGSQYPEYTLDGNATVTQSLWRYADGDTVVTFRLSAITLAVLIDQGVISDGTFDSYYATAAANQFLGNKYDFIHLVISAIYSGRVNGCDTGTARRAVIDAAIYLNNSIDWYASQLSGYRLYVAGNLSGRPQDVIWIEPAFGSLRIVKSSSNPSLTNGNSCYSLAGAVYTVYQAGTNNVVGTITTNSNGEGSLSNLPAGNYEIQETKAPSGYVLDTSRHQVTIPAGSTYTYQHQDTPGNDPFAIIVQKVNGHGSYMDPEELANAGEPTLAGAEFTVKYYNGNAATGNPTRQWIIKTDDDFYTRLDQSHLVSGDAFYTTSNGTVTLPLGTVTVEETKAPDGYLRDETVYVGHIVADSSRASGGRFEWESNQGLILENQPDGSILTGVINELVPKLDTVAADSVTGTHMGRAVENETIVDTINYEDLVDGKEYVLKGRLVDQATGETIVDAQGREVTSEVTFTPTAKDGSVQMTFNFDASNLQGKTCVVFQQIYKNGRLLASHEDLNDDDQKVYYPGIQTVALSEETGLHMGIIGDLAVVKDTIRITNLYDSGETFTLKGALVDSETGDVLTRPNGKEAVASGDYSFGGDGVVKAVSVDVTFDYLSKYLEGKSAVVYEELYLGDTLIASHKDLTDENQTVNHPSLKTTALDQATGSHTGVVGEKQTIVDTVAYTNLVSGKTYTVKGQLVYKDSGAAVVDADGNAVTAERTFMAEMPSGTVELTYTVDSSLLAGKVCVVFETLYLDNTELVTHADLTDEAQTIYYPQIRTEAKDASTGDQVAAVKTDCEIVDTVSYKNLDPAKSYTLKGTLMNKSTGDAVKNADGSDVTSEYVFSPEAAEGSVAVTFRFDATSLAGEDVVVFEELYEGNVMVVDHKDLDDNGQTVSFPEIGTSAKDPATGSQTGVVGGTQEIVDTVSYKNLIIGKEYTISGTLMNKATEEPMKDADGNAITAETTFTAETEDGSVDLVYEIDTSLLEGATVVVFEDLIHNGVEVDSHAEIEDEDQSVFYPEVKTTAVDASMETEDGMFNGPTGTHTGAVREDAVITDTVAYRNLLENTTYRIDGRLVDAETGEPVLAVENREVETLTVRTTKAGIPISLADQDGNVIESGTVNANFIYVFQDIEKGNYVLTLDGEEIPVVYDENGASADESILLESVAAGTVTHSKGNPITASMTFTTSEGEGSRAVSGTVDLTYVLDSTVFEGQSVVVFENLYLNDVLVNSHEDLTDTEQTVNYPSVETVSLDDATGTHTAALGEEVTITDTVSYRNVERGTPYSVTGTLMVKETGKALTNADGTPVTSEVTFVPTERDGSVKLSFTVDTTKLAGQTLVAFDVLYENGIVVNRHEDLDNSDQSIFVPEIHTNASDGQTGTQEGAAKEQTTIVDTVTYKNLIPGQTYHLSGYLVVKPDAEDTDVPPVQEGLPESAEEEQEPEGEMTEDVTDGGTEDPALIPEETPEAPEGEPENGQDTVVLDPNALLDADGNPIYGVLVDADGNVLEGNNFVPETANGTIDLVYTFDSSLLKGEDVVVFEDMYTNDIKVATHADIEDENQTVHYPEIGTLASDGTSETSQGTVVGDTAIIKDVVSYKNLIPGEYIVRGTLMDKETGEELLDANGEPIVVTAPLVVEDEPDGTVTLTFEMDKEVAEGKTIVVFEKLFLNNIEITQHEDIEDEGQTVDFPKLRTHAQDGTTEDEDHVGATTEKTTIVDTVSYENLRVGTEYTVKGALMDKDTGEPILDKDGKEITAEKTFTAKESDGTVELVYELDSSLIAGKTVVVFEDLYVEELHIATHTDLDDEEQSVHYPGVGTEATVDGSHVTTAGSRTELVDVVDYTNLVVGKEYTIKGVLMDQATGKPITVNGVEITAEATFTAETPDGQIEMTFVFDSSLLGSKTIVVFETLYKDGKEIAAHTDLTDAAQSVEFKAPPTEVNTNDPGMPFVAGGIFFAAFAVAVLFIVLKKKSRREID